MKDKNKTRQQLTNELAEMRQRIAELEVADTERKRMEQSLRESEEKIRNVFESITDGIFAIDINGNYTEVNDSLCYMHGLNSKDDILKKNAFEFVAQRDLERAAIDFQRTLETGKVTQLEYTAMKADGSEFPAEVSAVVIRDVSGNAVGIIGSLRDITERKLAEEVLRESEAKYRDLAENINDIIYTVDQNGVITYVSPVIESVLGYSPDELLGQSFADKIHQEDMQSAAESFLNTLSGNSSMGEFRLLSKSGEVRWIRTSNRPLFEGDSVVGATGVLSDITESKLVDDAMRESEERYRLLAENVTDVIWTMDMNLKYTYISPSVMHQRGYSVEEAMTQGLEENLTPASIETAIKIFQEGLAAEKMEPKDQSRTWTVELEVYCKDGSTIWTEQETTFLRDADGQPVGIMGVSRDISERKRAEQELRGSEEKLRIMFECTSEGIAITDLKGKILDVNDAILGMSGLSREELVGQEGFGFVPTEDGKRIIEQGTKAIKSETGTEKMSQETTPTFGRAYDVDLSIGVLRDSSGDPTGFVAIARDDTERKRAKEMLLQREQDYLMLLESTAEGIIVVDSETLKVVFGNRRAVRMFELESVEDGIGVNILDFIEPEDREIAIRGFAEDVFGEERRQRYELRANTKAGRQIWISALGTRTDFQGRVAVLLSISDITERKLAEDELRESEERYRLLAENVTDVIWTTDMNLRLTYVSPSITHQRGYCVEEAMTRGIQQDLTPASLEIATKTMSEGLAAEKVEPRDLSKSWTIECELYCKDGSTIWAEQEITFLRDADGQPVGIQGVSRDITERKRAEEALRDSEYRLQELVENIGSGVAVYKPINGGKDFVFLNFNKAGEKIGGISKEKVIGKPVTEVLPGIKKFGLLDVFQRVNETGKAEHFPISFYEDERIKGWRENFVYKLPSGELVAVYEDITERKRAEEERERLIHELERSNDELQEFAHVASHDLQEPLRMVASYTQLLEKRYKGNLDADADEFIAYAVDGALRMQDMIESLLYYSRVGSRRKPLQPVESESAFEQAMADLKFAIDESGAEITHDPLPQVMADKTQLIQLFQNLLGNAIKFRGKEQPRIHVSAKQDSNEYLFSVSDNGIGMNPKYFERIFVIFQRLHGREEYPGTGVGLSICRRIMERHGGRIWVESQPGEGSTFYFTIPKGSEEQ